MKTCAQEPSLFHYSAHADDACSTSTPLPRPVPPAGRGVSGGVQATAKPARPSARSAARSSAGSAARSPLYAATEIPSPEPRYIPIEIMGHWDDGIKGCPVRGAGPVRPGHCLTRGGSPHSGSIRGGWGTMAVMPRFVSRQSYWYVKGILVAE